MKVPVFRSLDRSNKLFGIKGSYIIYAAALLAVALVLGLLVGSLVGSGLVGTVAFIAFSAAAYMYVVKFQSEHSEKERDQMLSSLTLPDIVRVRPAPFTKLFKVKFNLRQENKCKA